MVLVYQGREQGSQQGDCAIIQVRMTVAEVRAMTAEVVRSGQMLDIT